MNLDEVGSDDVALPAWVCDGKTGDVLKANSAAARLLGFDPAEVNGGPLARMVRGDVDDLFRRAFPAVDDPVLAGRWTLARKDGSEISTELASAPSDWEGRPARVLFALSPSKEGDRERFLDRLAGCIRRQTALYSLAREATSTDPDLKSVLERMLREAGIALDGAALSLWRRPGRGRPRLWIPSETPAPTSGTLEIELPLDRPWRAELRCVPSAPSGFSVEDVDFLGGVSVLAALAVHRHARPRLEREIRGLLNRVLDGAGDAGSDGEDPILDALRETGGNRSAAARLLGMSRVTLWKRLKGLGEA